MNSHHIIEEVNYHNDHRVIARDKKAWFIEVKNGNEFVAVKVPTKDYFWLRDHDFDPNEYDEGELIRPMETNEYRYDGPECRSCAGSGRRWRHRTMRGIEGPKVDELHLQFYGELHPITEAEEIECRYCHGHGRDGALYKLDEPRLVEGAEDRVYVPFRVVAWPCRMVDCEICRGTGRHVDPSIDASGISSADFDEDPDFREQYFGGTYDVICYGCKGTKKVPAIHVEAMCPEDRELYDIWYEWHGEQEREEAAWRAEQAAERRMGC